MEFIIIYEFMQNGLPRYEYTIIEHENIDSALDSFKHQNPYLKPMSIRPLNNSLYI